MTLTAFLRDKSSFNPFVTGITFSIVILLVASTLSFPEQSRAILDSVKSGIFQHFSWFYILICSIFLFFLIFISMSSLGNIKLGSNEEVPEFKFVSWLAMLFAAGMGVGLMFFGVAEPLSHYTSNITSGSSEQRAQAALLHTVFHWGMHAWAIYGVIALALAYFGFRYKLPLALRSCFYPFFKEQINGRIGDIIDIMALVATLFGIITTLGFGATQLSSGLNALGWFENNGFGLQVGVIIAVIALAVFSAVSGVGKGVKILSEINLTFALLLMLFVLATGPTLHLLSAFSENIGTYLGNAVQLSFKTYAYETEQIGWFNGWTVLYWAWWCSWAPFVGLFIARISRGRTVREFVFGVLAIPSLFCVLWFTVFGNSAIWLDTQSAQGALSAMSTNPEILLFKFFDYLPLPQLSGTIALFCIALFFITSADSGIYVLNNIASRDKSLPSPRWQALMWGGLMSITAITLLSFGGLASLQTMTLIAALPFMLLMALICINLSKALLMDKQYFDAKFNPTTVLWSAESWRDRLHQMMNQTADKDIIKFLKQTALPAMRELRNELRLEYELSVDVISNLEADEPFVEFVIHKESLQDFMYGIRSVAREISEQLINDDKLPHIRQSTVYEPISYFSDGRSGYDVQYMTHDEIIADILKHYERYLSLLTGVGQELMAHEPTELAE